ncbi:MAG TPA: MMPL family transporter, partial [Candidatus Omnitrophota bacterium]|nr:MMPL family transporter [Candidatus Omnitrophota bacterium]
ALSAFLYSIEEVDKVSSVNDYLKDINQSFHNEDPVFYALPDTKEMAAQYVLLYGREDLEDFVDEQWQWATVRVRLKEHSSVKLEHVIKKIDEYVQENFADLEERNTLGQTVLEVDTNNSVTLGQVQSLGMAMAVIFGMMFLVFRSVPVGVVSMVPNILPILLNFGIMGIFNIRLDSATSMIAAIGIGIVVDDTIHFLHGFGEFLSGHGDYTRAMHETLKTRGRPIIFTSVVLFFGFGVVGFSKFMLTAYFGILTALLMFTALLADLMLTPSLLIVFKPPFWKGGDKEND